MNKEHWAKLAKAAHDEWWTDRETEVILLHYHKGWAIEDVAAELYVSRSTVNRVLKDIRAKLARM